MTGARRARPATSARPRQDNPIPDAALGLPAVSTVCQSSPPPCVLVPSDADKGEVPIGRFRGWVSLPMQVETRHLVWVDAARACSVKRTRAEGVADFSVRLMPQILTVCGRPQGSTHRAIAPIPSPLHPPIVSSTWNGWHPCPYPITNATTQSDRAYVHRGYTHVHAKARQRCPSRRVFREEHPTSKPQQVAMSFDLTLL